MIASSMHCDQGRSLRSRFQTVNLKMFAYDFERNSESSLKVREIGLTSISTSEARSLELPRLYAARQIASSTVYALHRSNDATVTKVLSPLLIVKQ